MCVFGMESVNRAARKSVAAAPVRGVSLAETRVRRLESCVANEVSTSSCNATGLVSVLKEA